MRKSALGHNNSQSKNVAKVQLSVNKSFKRRATDRWEERDLKAPSSPVFFSFSMPLSTPLFPRSEKLTSNFCLLKNLLV